MNGFQLKKYHNPKFEPPRLDGNSVYHFGSPDSFQQNPLKPSHSGKLSRYEPACFLKLVIVIPGFLDETIPALPPPIPSLSSLVKQPAPKKRKVICNDSFSDDEGEDNYEIRVLKLWLIIITNFFHDTRQFINSLLTSPQTPPPHSPSFNVSSW